MAAIAYNLHAQKRRPGTIPMRIEILQGLLHRNSRQTAIDCAFLHTSATRVCTNGDRKISACWTAVYGYFSVIRHKAPHIHQERQEV